MKYIFSLLAAVMTVTFVYGTEADAAARSVFVNDGIAQFDEDPVLIRGTNYIELRGLCNALDYQIGWQQSSKTASCTGDGSMLTFSFNGDTYTYNGQRKRFDNPPRIINGRSMIGLREVSQILNHRVHWIQLTGDVFLMRPGITDGEKGQMIDALLERMTERRQFSGAAAVKKEGDVITADGYGYADRSRSIRNGTDTSFAIASVTKGMTGMAAMKLEEEGRIDLDDRLGDYLPDVEYAEEVTLRQLLTHTSGYPWEYPNGDKTIGTLVYEPGEGQRYSNIGYQLMGDVIAKVTGMSYGDYIEEHVFERADMLNSGFDINTVHPYRRAVGYRLDNGRFRTVNRDFAARGASGSLYASVEDLLKFDDAIRDGTIISDDAVERMLQRHAGTWGYGWQVYNPSSGRVSQLVGSTTGFRSFLKREDGQPYTVVLLSNMELGDQYLNTLGKTIEDIIR
ncbi:serine hydrolase [Alkalicoccus urumqiensis]|uniref:Beta-lactamase-related domain-containing protein n=1 Tax=Alkalicoccus urumqiensis TaxID=1548213 RepID=A0A2P6ML79_ALKUR|nr:serine hydrolase [Alkalicoccus urumqiensis]PRO67046.1 hypothetical protein C6I21_00320 [Alkalicoccus urumqiensis]